MDEIDVLKDAFGPDEAPSATARDGARTALLNRIAGPAVSMGTSTTRRRPRWGLRITAAVTAAAAVTAGIVAVESGGLGLRQDDGGNQRAGGAPQSPGQRTVVPALPFAKPAKAAEVLENAAWTAAHKQWVAPRPDQFMYVETLATRNNRKVLNESPNGPLVKGKTEKVRLETWMRIDGQVQGGRDNGGKLEITRMTAMHSWGVLPYDDISKLTTPDKYQKWRDTPAKPMDIEPWALLMDNVVPPQVEAAVFRWLARQPGVRIDPKSVNLDGRPAIALTYSIEGYLKSDLLFDPETYAMIGNRLVAVKDHVNEALDGTTRIKAGDVFRLEVRSRAGIVNNVGDTA